MPSSDEELKDYLDEVDRRASKPSLSNKGTNKLTDGFLSKAINDPKGTILYSRDRDTHTLWGIAYLLQAARWNHADTEYLHRLQEVKPFDIDTDTSTRSPKSTLWTERIWQLCKPLRFTNRRERIWMPSPHSSTVKPSTLKKLPQIWKHIFS